MRKQSGTWYGTGFWWLASSPHLRASSVLGVLGPRRWSGLSRRSARRTAVRHGHHGHHSYGSGGMLDMRSWNMGDFNQERGFKQQQTCKNWALDKRHVCLTLFWLDICKCRRLFYVILQLFSGHGFWDLTGKRWEWGGRSTKSSSSMVNTYCIGFSHWWLYPKDSSKASMFRNTQNCKVGTGPAVPTFVYVRPEGIRHKVVSHVLK